VACLLAEALYHDDHQVLRLPDHSTEPPRVRRQPGTVTHNGH
jgi:hypothetical protein